MPDRTPITFEDLDKAPTGLPETHESVPWEHHKKLQDAFTKVTVDYDEVRIQLNETRTKIEADSILNELMKPYAKRTFIFMCVYCGYVGIILACGMIWTPLPERLLETLVGSTAVTVFGLVGMILTGIFVGARGKR